MQGARATWKYLEKSWKKKGDLEVLEKIIITLPFLFYWFSVRFTVSFNPFFPEVVIKCFYGEC
jgi:hypothetical protein